MLYHLIIKPIVRFFTRLFGYSTVEDLVDDNVDLDKATKLLLWVAGLGVAGLGIAWMVAL